MRASFVRNLIPMLLLVLTIVACKPRNTSGLSTLNDQDIEAILGLREKYDDNVKKVLIFIASEDQFD